MLKPAIASLVALCFAPAFSAERVPTLDQVLLACKDRARVLIELKYYGHTQRLEERVVEIVESLEMVDQISIMSLELSGIQKIRALRPGWPVGLLGTVVIGDPTRLDVDFLAFTTRAASRSLIRRAHGRGQRVLVWTVNDPVQMSMLASSGVDGLITDRPAVARSVLAQRAEMTPVERLLVDLGGRFGILEGGWESSERSDA